MTTLIMLLLARAPYINYCNSVLVWNMEDTMEIESTSKPVSTLDCLNGVDAMLTVDKLPGHPVPPDPHAIWTLCRPRMPWWGG
jgi:hypothetical protein